MSSRPLLVVLAVLVSCACAGRAQLAITEAFTYQGRLGEAGSPYTGTADFEFRLWDSASGGNQVGPTVLVRNVDVVEGLFTVELNFSVGAFNGDQRWLEPGVRTPGLSTGAYTTLGRQKINATPYALQTKGLPVSEFGHLGIKTAPSGYVLDVGGSVHIDGPLAVNHTSPTEQIDVEGSIMARTRLLAGYPSYFFWADASSEFVGIGRNTRVTAQEVFGIRGDTSGFAGMYIDTEFGGEPFYGYSYDGAAEAYHYMENGEWKLWNNGSVVLRAQSDGDLIVSGGLTADGVIDSGGLNTGGVSANSVQANNPGLSTAGSFSNNASVPALYARNFGSGPAANFVGEVMKSSGSFIIDHPLDPENRYLRHSFVESPDMMNVYNGNVVTDSEGLAVVELPHYFEALNRDYRYQLTVIGTFAQAIVERKVEGNSFVIRTDRPEVEVSWQVTGVRDDAYARMKPIPVEPEKAPGDRGLYLHPEAFGQDPSLARLLRD
ncbi:MAG: hypothetical protein ACF8Q5_15120 [Phycisphaerales bacterium JB040]